MWGESSKACENNCQCDGLITENFTINSGNSATKRKQEAAASTNYKLKMNPHSLTFSPSSPNPTPSKRRVLGEINFNSSLKMDRYSSNIERLKHSPMDILSPKPKSPTIISPLASLASPLMNSPIISTHSPLTTRVVKHRISKIFEDRTKFKMDKENFFKNEYSFTSESYTESFKTDNYSVESQSFNVESQSYSGESQSYSVENFKEESYVIDMEETARDFSFGERFQENRAREATWSPTKLNFTNALATAVPEPDLELHALQDLEAELESDPFEMCSKYEIISTDSPNVISRGRQSSRKVASHSFSFGAPLASSEPSTCFPTAPAPPPRATRTLTFDEDFEFPSPSPRVARRGLVKRGLKFDGAKEQRTLKAECESEKAHRTLRLEGDGTPVRLRHERSDSSIGSMSETSPRLTRIFTSDSTTSMESGFISELDEPFLDLEDSGSPKIANFNELLSGKIKDNILTGFSSRNFEQNLTGSEESQDLTGLTGFGESSVGLREPKAVTERLRRPLARSLSFHPESRASLIAESPSEEKRKREDDSACASAKRRRCDRPALQRALSENNASIKSALARSACDNDLIGDYSARHRLPLARCDLPDLKAISADTLAALLRGDYRDLVPHYQIIDCRYPYEFEGGHIASAINLHTPELLEQFLRSPPRAGTVLVLHCEFSIERGPKLARTLRSLDRALNRARYPALTFPELYVLRGGYRAAHRALPPALCAPPGGYTRMLDPRHAHLLRRHRASAHRRLLL